MEIANGIQSAPELQKLEVTNQVAQTARDRLRAMKSQLINGRGQIRSGYLRLTETGRMNAGGIFSGGSRTQATASVKVMLMQAYGESLGRAGKFALERALDTYLQRTGDRIGTKSFVKLIQTLDKTTPADDGQSVPIAAGPEHIESRLDLSDPDLLSAQGLDRFVADLKEERKSPISDAAMRQFQELAQAMKTEQITLKWFKGFKGVMFPTPSRFNPAQAVQRVDVPRTFAMGDADGSMGRMVLHAIASGVAELPKQSMPALARVMAAEAIASRIEGGLERFQANQTVCNDLEHIAETLVVIPKPQDGKPACVFLGDILSDRFTNNQRAMETFIYKLSGVNRANGERQHTGVCFIAGNHDTVPQGVDHVQWGGNALHKLDQKAYGHLLLKCFTAAHYGAGVLITHNGVSGTGKPNRYRVGFSDGSTDHREIRADGPGMLAQQMNRHFRQQVFFGCCENLISTDFRPEDSEMTPEALGLTAVPHFRQLHGHNATANEDHIGVTNLNARDSREQFTPMGVVIEYADGAPIIETPPANPPART